MSVNVESFDSFDTDMQIAAHQAGLVRIILEGKSDVDLFTRFWFGSMRETFEFMESSRLIAGSGCTAVRSAVDHSINVDGVPAVGIVDRDSLFRERRWDILFEVDEEKFMAGTQTPEVYVASLWEVEAYMLDPNLLSDWVYSAHRNPPGSEAECETALQRAVSECEFLLNIAYFFAAVHTDGISLKDSYFRGQSLADAKATCTEKLATLSVNSQAVATQVETLIAEVRNRLPDNEAEQLHFLLRYVDTKRLMIRLFQTLQVRDDSHWVLPPMQSRSNRRPAELEGFLKNVESRYAT